MERTVTEQSSGEKRLQFCFGGKEGKREGIEGRDTYNCFVKLLNDNICVILKLHVVGESVVFNCEKNSTT